MFSRSHQIRQYKRKIVDSLWNLSINDLKNDSKNTDILLIFTFPFFNTEMQTNNLFL